MHRFLLTTFFCLLLVACGSSKEKPIGSGSGLDELRKSPCACMAVPEASQWAS